MSWLNYLLEANLYLIIFYGFYKLVLCKETFYTINRFYLIFTSLAAFTLPFLQLGILKYPKILAPKFAVDQEINQADFQVYKMQVQPQETIFTVNNALVMIYLLVTLIFLLKLIISFARIMKMQKSAYVIIDKGIKLIDLKESKIAFSFFNLLFLDPDLPEKSTILKHELVHIKQKHSIDVIFFEILQIVNWFNPICYFIKDDVKLTHEYLADEETTNYEIEKYNYAMFLIQNSLGPQNFALSNQIFNSSKLKRRINMLNQKRSTSWARLKLLLVLPLVASMLVASTLAFAKNETVLDLYPQKIELHKIAYQDTIVKKEKEKLPTLLVKKQYPQRKEKQVFKKTAQLEPPSQTHFYSRNIFSGETGKVIKVDPRYIIINDKGFEDNKFFVGAENTETVIYLSQQEAINKYGQKGKNGAVEVTGQNIKMLDKFIPMPPSPKLSINRGRNEVLTIPDSDFESKTLTVYNSKGSVVYNTTDYHDDWDGKKGNYGKYNSALPEGKYQYLMKITGEPFKNKRGVINIIDKFPTLPPIQKTNAPKNKSENLEKIVLLPPPPARKNKEVDLRNTYNVDVVINRSKGEKLVSPKSEKGKKSVTIYTERGEKVFKSSDYKNDWEGKFNSFTKKRLNEGRYNYQIIVTQLNGAPSKVIRGSISLK